MSHQRQAGRRHLGTRSRFDREVWPWPGWRFDQTRAGTLALVANRSEGTVSVLSINGKIVTPVGDKIELGDEKSGPSAVVFTPDGKFALVTRDNDHKISVLAVDGTKVTDTKREISAGLRPYGLDIAQQGDVAIVANIGTNSGDADTVSVIDLAAKPQRVVSTVTVGQTPEGIKISPDGIRRHLRYERYEQSVQLPLVQQQRQARDPASPGARPHQSG